MTDQLHVTPARPAARAATPLPTCEGFHAHPSKIARVRRRLLDQRAGEALADIFKALGDITRVRLLDALAQSELCVCDLAALVGLSESAISHQLRLLRGMRIVRARRSGRMVYYALDDEHVIGLFQQGLRHVEEAAPRRRAEPDGTRTAEGSQPPVRRVQAPRRSSGTR